MIVQHTQFSSTSPTGWSVTNEHPDSETCGLCPVGEPWKDVEMDEATWRSLDGSSRVPTLTKAPVHHDFGVIQVDVPAGVVECQHCETTLFYDGDGLCTFCSRCDSCYEPRFTETVARGGWSLTALPGGTSRERDGWDRWTCDDCLKVEATEAGTDWPAINGDSWARANGQ